jgi:glycerophosphoryl diester phosphodiesterase
VTPGRAFLNIAHRGGRAFAPENTLPAIRMARRLGGNVVELDVQMSRDGELVMIHDDEVTRCSDAQTRFPGRSDYSVVSFTWHELAQLDAGSWFVDELARPTSERQPYLRELATEEIEQWIPDAAIDQYRSGSVRILRLRDALEAAHECELAVVLDIKTIPRRYPDIASRAVELIRALNMEADSLMSSFDHALLAEVRRASAAIATGVLTAERLYRPREYVVGLAADAYHPGCSGADDVVRRGVSANEIDGDLIREITDAGLLLNVWTENDELRMRALIDAGVTGIVTDYPNRLRRVLDEMHRTAPTGPRLKSTG